MWDVSNRENYHLKFRGCHPGPCVTQFPTHLSPNPCDHCLGRYFTEVAKGCFPNVTDPSALIHQNSSRKKKKRAIWLLLNIRVKFKRQDYFSLESFIYF